MLLFSVDSSQNILRSFFLFLVVSHLNVFLLFFCIHLQMMKMCPFGNYFSIYFLAQLVRHIHFSLLYFLQIGINCVMHLYKTTFETPIYDLLPLMTRFL